jgi:hypothetical protein
VTKIEHEVISFAIAAIFGLLFLEGQRSNMAILQIRSLDRSEHPILFWVMQVTFAETALIGLVGGIAEILGFAL